MKTIFRVAIYRQMFNKIIKTTVVRKKKKKKKTTMKTISFRKESIKTPIKIKYCRNTPRSTTTCKRGGTPSSRNLSRRLRKL